jgi:hypothetical protein
LVLNPFVVAFVPVFARAPRSLYIANSLPLQPILSGKLASSSTAVGATVAHASAFSCTSCRPLKGAEERTQKKLNGIIADLLVDFTSLSASALSGSDEASSLFDVVRALCGARILACGGDYTSISAAHPNDRETSPVEKRAAKAPKQYHAATRDFDHKFQESQRREMDPVET